jgi:hypothetical protein
VKLSFHEKRRVGMDGETSSLGGSILEYYLRSIADLDKINDKGGISKWSLK